MAKIMLVEDDNNLREIYEARLLAEGYEIVSAKDGEEALALAVKERPDLIISDVMMPKISGFDMLDILRSTPETKETKVIMMTALSQAEDKARADKLGADRYLVKSQVTLEDVAKVAREVLQGEPEGPPSSSDFAPAVAEPPNDPVADSSAPAQSPTEQPPARGEYSPKDMQEIDSQLTQSMASEGAAVNAQIKDFIDQQPAADSSQPAPVAAPAQETPVENTASEPIEVKQAPSTDATNEAAETAEKLTSAVNDLLTNKPADSSEHGSHSSGILANASDINENEKTSTHKKVIEPVIDGEDATVDSKVKNPGDDTAETKTDQNPNNIAL